MRSLTSTLLAAQKSSSSLPYIHAVFSDYHGDVSRVRYQRHYNGNEGEYFSATVGTGDAALVRARIDPATKVLYIQRVASPGPGSTFSSWTSQGTVSSTGAVALASAGNSVYLFYVDTNNLTLRMKESTDNGATYGSPTTVTTASASVTYVAAAVSPAGERVLFWVEGASVYRSRYSAGAWGSRTVWTNSAASITGIACKHRLDFNLALCGTDSTTGDAKVWTAIYGDDVEQPADVWGPLVEVSTASANSNVSFRSPALEFLQHWRLFFVEKYTGSQAYSRLQWTTMNGAETYANEAWREPVAFDYEGNYGVAATARNLGGGLWLSSAAGVWSGLSPSYPDVEVSDDIVEASVDLDETDGRARLVLRNDPEGNGDAGRFAGYGSDAIGSIQRGTRLQLAAGYRTTAGPETPLSAAYWVESIEQTTGAGARLIIEARDAWWLLERWRAKHQFVWAAGTRSVVHLLLFVCARAGLSMSGVGASSDALTDLQPAFTIHPGESGRTAVQRLLAMVPDVAFSQAGALRLGLPLEADSAEYAYAAPARAGSTQHAIVQGRYRDAGPDANRVRVLGAGVFNERFDFAEIEAVGERNEQVLDLNLATVAEAGDRADFELRGAAIRARRDEVRISGVNCGQELYDIVSLTDAQAGLEDVRRRVLGLSWRYRSDAAGSGRSGPVYDMTLQLGSP